jgi:hypothetical protein
MLVTNFHNLVLFNLYVKMTWYRLGKLCLGVLVVGLELGEYVDLGVRKRVRVSRWGKPEKHCFLK